MTNHDNKTSYRNFVIALGGNAIIPAGSDGTYAEQRQLTRETMDQVAQIAADGHQVVLTHGNGPVVGNIVLRSDAGQQLHGIPAMPMYICGADSQGGIGFMIQQELQNALFLRKLARPVAALVTQVTVDPQDPAFTKPTKPIGPFYDKQQADKLEKENGWTIVSDANRGFRRVVPSPMPVEVVEWQAIQALTKADVLTIAVGGGGIPVYRDADGILHGVDAVIDKDRASDLLGRLIGADTLVMITSVEKVCLRFGKSDAEPLAELTAGQAAEFLAAGEFPPGSMGPKIESALSFLAAGGSEVIITDPPSLLAAIHREAGTRIISG